MTSKFWIFVADWSRVKSSEPNAGDVARKIGPLYFTHLQMWKKKSFEVQLAKYFPDQMAKSFHNSEWVSFSISTFFIIKRNSFLSISCKGWFFFSHFLLFIGNSCFCFGWIKENLHMLGAKKVQIFWESHKILKNSQFILRY